MYTTVRISAIPTFLSKTSSLFFSEQARRQKTQRPPPPPLPPARLVRRLRDDGDGPQATGRRLKKPASARRRARIFLGEESHRPLRETSERPPRNNGRSRHALRELRTPPHGTALAGRGGRAGGATPNARTPGRHVRGPAAGRGGRGGRRGGECRSRSSMRQIMGAAPQDFGPNHPSFAVHIAGGQTRNISKRDGPDHLESSRCCARSRRPSGRRRRAIAAATAAARSRRPELASPRVRHCLPCVSTAFADKAPPFPLCAHCLRG